MMPPDVISHENQLQHLSEPSIFMLDVFRTADHAGQIFIPHRLTSEQPAAEGGAFSPAAAQNIDRTNLRQTPT